MSPSDCDNNGQPEMVKWATKRRLYCNLRFSQGRREQLPSWASFELIILPECFDTVGWVTGTASSL